ncbi:MAG TPA: hypothetical protein VF053_10050 [Streptosporangiales bacterium]
MAGHWHFQKLAVTVHVLRAWLEANPQAAAEDRDVALAEFDRLMAALLREAAEPLNEPEIARAPPSLRTQWGLVRGLADRVGELRPLYEKHVAQRGYVAPEEFLAELASWVAEAFVDAHREDGTGHDWITVIDLLEQACVEDPSGGLAELVRQAFVANLPPPGEPGYEVNFMLFGTLARDRERYVARMVARPELLVGEDQAAFVAGLVDQVPALGARYQDHVAAYGMLLPDLFLLDVVHWLVRDHRRARWPWSRRRDWARVLRLVEDAYVREYDGRVGQLIAVSFLENLPADGEPGHGLVDELGPWLRRDLDRARDVLRTRDGPWLGGR